MSEPQAPYQHSGRIVDVIVPAVPSPDVSPNGRVNWRVKAKAAKELRQIAMLAALPNGKAFGPVTRPCKVSYTIYWPKGARKMDPDNAIGSCKALLDGLCDAGVIANDRNVTGFPEVKQLTGMNSQVMLSMHPHGCVRVTIEEADDE